MSRRTTSESKLLRVELLEFLAATTVYDNKAVGKIRHFFNDAYFGCAGPAVTAFRAGRRQAHSYGQKS